MLDTELWKLGLQILLHIWDQLDIHGYKMLVQIEEKLQLLDNLVIYSYGMVTLLLSKVMVKYLNQYIQLEDLDILLIEVVQQLHYIMMLLLIEMMMLIQLREALEVNYIIDTGVNKVVVQHDMEVIHLEY